VVGEVANSLRPLAATKHLDLNVDLPGQEIVVMADRRALNQILINLTTNAIKFTERGQVRIELRTRRDDGRKLVEISVVDTGIGIRAEDQARLFQAFEQVGPASTRLHEGTGLGLHLSQKLAELLGARITFQSEYGKGSRFTTVLEGQ
jgi:signal transduction histidine kinase